MQIYKISYNTNSGESGGFSYGSTKKEALENKPDTGMSNKVKKIEKIEIEYSKEGIITALNFHASHPDNG